MTQTNTMAIPYSLDAASRRPIGASINLIHAWIERHCTRRELGHLDERMMRDVGLDGIDVQREMAKPFWRP